MLSLARTGADPMLSLARTGADPMLSLACTAPTRCSVSG